LDSELSSGASPAAQAFGGRGNGSQSTDQSNQPPAPDTFESGTETNMDARLLPNIETVAYSGTGNATLVGNQRDNTIAGNTGDDTITGGAGNDQLIGGAGADVFVFSADDGADQILDFSRADKLQFDGLTDLNQIRLEELDEGVRVYFAETQVDLIGVYGLEVSADWISSSR
jgi:Ca2+-binding RTX toxin-like protein